MQPFFDTFGNDTMWGQPFGAAPHSRFNAPSYRQRPQTARRGSAADYLHRHEEQQKEARHQAERTRQQQHEAKRRKAEHADRTARDMAAAQLEQYGFTDRAAIADAIERFGPNNVKACARALLEEQRLRHQSRHREESKRSHSEASSSSYSMASSSSGSSGSSVAPSTSSSAFTFPEQDDASESQCPSPPTTPMVLDPSPQEQEVLKLQATMRIQGVVRSTIARRDTNALTKCTATIMEIDSAAKIADEKWVGPNPNGGVLEKGWRDVKMLNGVPVELIAYEESLLRLQMKLDNLTPGNVTEETRQAVRVVRREAVRRIQERLDRIDECQQWWKSSAPGSTMQAQAEAQAQAA